VSPLDLAFVLGALVSPIIGILSIIALAVVRPAPRAMWLWVTLVGVTAVAWITYWFLWGKAFDQVDAGLDPNAKIEVAMGAAIWVSAVGCVGLAMTMISASWSARPARAASS